MEDFIRQYDEAPFELVDGERIPLTLQTACAPGGVNRHTATNALDGGVLPGYSVPLAVLFA
jgi:hypothetical protein